MLKIKGLGLAQDLNPSSDVCGCVVSLLGKENSVSNNDEDSEEDASISALMRQLMLKCVI